MQEIKNKILWICPTRRRPEKLQRMIDSFYETTDGLADLLIAIDSDDNSYEQLIFHNNSDCIIWEINEPTGGKFLHLLNKMAMKYVDEYKFIGFMEDDVVFKTKNENAFIGALSGCKYGIAHGNDCINTPTLVSLPVMTNRLIKDLGFFAPLELNCLWADYFWKELCKNGVQEHYFAEVIIQHMHYSVTDKVRDETTVNLEQMAQSDFSAYNNYINGKFRDDIKKLFSTR